MTDPRTMKKTTLLPCPFCNTIAEPQKQSYRDACEDGGLPLGTIIRFTCENGHNFYIDKPHGKYPFLGEEEVEED